MKLTLSSIDANNFKEFITPKVLRDFIASFACVLSPSLF